jgi:hypothetical protein
MSALLRGATACALAFALAGSAFAQEAPAPPAGDATVRVRLLHASGPERVAGAEVILYSLSAEGEPGLRRERADADGHATFAGLSNDPAVVYLVGTRLAGVPFGTRFAFAQDERERQVEIAVADPSDDVAAAAPGDTSLRLEAGCRDLRVHHTHTLENRSERVIHVQPERRDGAAPLLELELPEGASAIETPLGGGEGGFVRSGNTLRFWGPLYPGLQEIEFGYGVPLERADPLILGFPRGAQSVRVLTPADGLEATSGALEPEGERPLPLGVHRVQRAGPLAAGAALSLAIGRVPSATSGEVAIVETRLWLELDDAALDVSEQHQLDVAGATTLESGAGAPLLCLGLPAEARDLRFGSESFELGISRDPSGALSVRGPLPAGESMLSLRYRLPVESEPFAFTRSFGAPIELLSLLVADTGILPQSTRLHPRRPFRNESRAYLRLEAFAVDADETIELSLERLERKAPAGLASTLGSVDSAPRVERESAEAIERIAVYEAIEAIDEDYETGKLSEADHGALRDELRARAVALLQAERSSAQPAPVPTPSTCPGCQASARPGDRFCAQCGAVLTGPESAAT